MTPEEILDALSDIAALEHAHCVYYLRFHYALGGDPPERQPGHVPAGVRQAASDAMLIALGDMSHLKHVNRILVGAGREPVLDRTEAAPMTAVHFTHFPDRELALARALDGAYARVRAGLAAPAPPLIGPVLEDLTNLLESAGTHAGSVPALAGNLAALTPAQYLLVTGEAPDGEVDRRLLALSDRIYAALLEALRAFFADTGFLGGFLQQARDRMDDMHAVNGILGLQGLLPPFTLPD
jgi:hypothetical protein